MIFISYSHSDSNLVDKILSKLGARYSKESFFYDKWSILPGDGIIDKMNDGLSKCTTFFFFMSTESIQSGMTSLEWQSALMKKAKKSLAFIPIKIDDCDPPDIILQNLYIDFSKTGFDIAFCQMCDVIEKHEINIKILSQNILAEYKKLNENHYFFTINAYEMFDPVAKFVFIIDNPFNSFSCKIVNFIMYPPTNFTVILNGKNYNAVIISKPDGISPKFPIKIDIKCTQKIHFIKLLHIVGENEEKEIPLKEIK